jgi:hypothetical protein
VDLRTSVWKIARHKIKSFSQCTAATHMYGAYMMLLVCTAIHSGRLACTKLVCDDSWSHRLAGVPGSQNAMMVPEVPLSRGK